MTYKAYKNESFNLYTIKTNRFKTCHLEIIFYKDLDKKNITRDNVLCDILSYSSLKYPKRKNVVEKLEDLYNASFFSTTSRIGNIRTINFIFNFINPEYTDKTYAKEVIKFPFEMIFHPNIQNDEFDSRTLKIIKNRILADIESIKEAPTRYSIKRAFINTDENMPASYQYTGNIEDLNKITTTNLVQYYKELLNDYHCDIYLLGNLNMDKMNQIITEQFQNNIIKTSSLHIIPEVTFSKKPKDIKEYDNFEQASLVCLYSLTNLTEKEQTYVLPVYNSILGYGSLANKLSQNLREKASLCYNIRSLYQKYDNILLVQTGIDIKNRTKAIKLIKKSLAEIKDGKISDDELQGAIQININSNITSMDYPPTIIDNYFLHNLINQPLLQDREEGFRNVSKQDVINLSKKINLLITYSISKGESK